MTREADGGFVAGCLTHDVFTHADTWEELRVNVREAVTAFFYVPPGGGGRRAQRAGKTTLS